MSLLRRKDSTHYWYDFTVGGKRYRGSTERTNKAEAGLVEAALRKAKLDAVQLGASDTWTLGTLADRWLTVAGAKLRDAKNNESRVRKLFGEELRAYGLEAGARKGLPRDLEVHRLTNGHLLNLVEARTHEGNAGATINRELALLQSMLRFAGEPGRNVALPAGLNFRPLRTREKQSTRFLTRDEEARLLLELEPTRVIPGFAAPENRTPGQRQLLQDQYDRTVLLLDTGARYEELVGLPWDAVDLARNQIHLYRSKTSNASALGLTARARAVLERRYAARHPSSPFIFPSPKDPRKPLGHTSDGLHAAMDRAGINAPHLVARHGRAAPNHVLRHTFANRLVDGGMSLEKVGELLGHASVATTARYGHMTTGRASDEAVQLLNRGT